MSETRGGDAPPVLPPPLSESLLVQVLADLPAGARLATETCYSCWKEGKFPTSEFVSFLRSISLQSQTLTKAFENAPSQDGGGEAVAMSDAPAGGSQGAVNSPADSATMAGGKASGDNTMQDVSGAATSSEYMGDFDNITDLQQHQLRLEEVQRRRFEMQDGDKLSRKEMEFCKWIISELCSVVPLSGKISLIMSIREYLGNNRASSVQTFAERIKRLVDKYQVILALAYVPKRPRDPEKLFEAGKRRIMEKPAMPTSRAQGSANMGDTKMRKKATLSDMAPGSNPRPSQQEKELTDTELTTLELQIGVLDQFTQEPLGAARLQDTPLGDYLSSKAKSVSTREVVVKVVADVLKQPHVRGRDGDGLPFRSKAVFAFQRVDHSKHFVICFGMFVNEYGPGCAPQHQGRVYIECIDSVPLYGLERGVEREALLSTIMHGYFDYARAMGFRHVHMRVPPPTDENSYIFASRSLIVRLRASLHLAHWYTRLLQNAKAQNIIHSYAGDRTGNMPNFPLSLLQPGEMAAELAFKNVDTRALDPQAQELMTRVIAQKERCFVIYLQPPNSSVILVPDIAPLLPSGVASDRQGFVGVCVSRRLRFASLQQAKYATLILVQKMLAEQQHAVLNFDDDVNVRRSMPGIGSMQGDRQAEGSRNAYKEPQYNLSGMPMGGSSSNNMGIGMGMGMGMMEERGMGRGFEDRGMARGMEERGMSDRGMSDRGMSDRGMGDRGMSDRGMSDRGMSDRGMSDRGMSDRGMSDRGMSDRGMSDRGMSDRGMSDRGMSDRGMSDRGMGDRGMGDRGMSDRGMSDRGMSDRGMSDRGMSDRGMGDRGMGDRGMGDRGMGDRGMGERGMAERGMGGVMDGRGMGMGMEERSIGRDRDDRGMGMGRSPKSFMPEAQRGFEDRSTRRGMEGMGVENRGMSMGGGRMEDMSMGAGMDDRVMGMGMGVGGYGPVSGGYSRSPFTSGGMMGSRNGPGQGMDPDPYPLPERSNGMGGGDARGGNYPGHYNYDSSMRSQQSKRHHENHHNLHHHQHHQQDMYARQRSSYPSAPPGGRAMDGRNAMGFGQEDYRMNQSEFTMHSLEQGLPSYPNEEPHVYAHKKDSFRRAGPEGGPRASSGMQTAKRIHQNDSPVDSPGSASAAGLSGSDSGGASNSHHLKKEIVPKQKRESRKKETYKEKSEKGLEKEKKKASQSEAINDDHEKKSDSDIQSSDSFSAIKFADSLMADMDVGPETDMLLAEADALC